MTTRTSFRQGRRRFLEVPSSSSSSEEEEKGRQRMAVVVLWDVLLKYIPHFVAVMMYIYGFVIRTKYLHTGEECTMTYSYREFIPIKIDEEYYHYQKKKKKNVNENVNKNDNHNNNFIVVNHDGNGNDDVDDDSDDDDAIMLKYYRLYKFVDRRDLRYTKLLKDVGLLKQPHQLSKDGSWNNLPTLISRRRKDEDNKLINNHCVFEDDDDDDRFQDRLHEDEVPVTSSTSATTRRRLSHTRRPVHVVLYIPGHWGSYSQARSIGAHGIQLSGASLPYSKIQHVQQSLLSGRWNGLGGGGGDRSSSGHSTTTTTTNATTGGSIENFAFEVYAVDFHEQGGALHGEFLYQQSQFVARAVTQLIDDCFYDDDDDDDDREDTDTHNNADSENSSSSSIIPPPTITLVGHSMGGYVARLTHLLHPQIRPYIRNIVTLATPHMNPLYAFDKSIYDIHRKMMTMTTADDEDDENDLPVVVAISGGLRDEMIAPTACQLLPDYSKHRHQKQQHAPFISILATRLMDSPSPQSSSSSSSMSSNLGMDHRAIAWCHEILNDVRKVIWAMVLSSSSSSTKIVTNNATERLEKIRNVLKLDNDVDFINNIGSKRNDDTTFLRDEATMRTVLWRKFGQVTAVCMEASMLYNLPYLLGLFLVISGLKFSSISPFQVLIVTIFLGITFSDIAVPWTVTIVLSFVANAANLLLAVGFGYLFRLFPSPQGGSLQPIQLIRNVMFVSLLLIVLGAAVASKFLPPNPLDKHLFQWDVLIYAYSILVTLFMLLFGIWHQCSLLGTTTKLHFFAIALLALPVTFAGSVTLIAWEHSTRRSSWETLLVVALPLNVWSTLNIFAVDRLHRERKYIDNRTCSSLRLRSILISCCTIGTCPWILSRGHGFMASYLLACLGWIDVSSTISHQLLCTRTKKRTE